MVKSTREAHWDSKIINHFAQKVSAVLAVRAMIRRLVAMGVLRRFLTSVYIWLRDRYLLLSTLK
jgi:hypothetical protein